MARSIPAELAALKRDVAQVKKGQRYAHGGSLENAAIEVKDDTGSLRAIVGQQADGTTAVNVVNGPPPPQPSAPIVASVLGGVTVSWDGQFADGSVVPLDFSRVEVHASLLASYDPVPATLQGTIETAQGATVVVPCDSDVYVRLVARNTSGSPSTASATVGPYGPMPVVADEILDGAVTASKLANGAVLLNTLGGPLADLATQRYADYMTDASAWSQLSASTGATWTVDPNATGTPSGGGKMTVTGSVQLAGTTFIPQDTDTLYRVMVRVRATAQDVSGPATVYLGLVGMADDKTTFVNRMGANSTSSHFYCASNGGTLAVADGWKTYVGYIQGHSADGATAPAGPNTDPRVPGTSHFNVRFLRPTMWLNFGKNTSAVMEVEAFTVEALRTGVVGSTNLITGSVTAAAIATDAVTADKILANAVTAAKIEAGAVTTGKLDALAVTADKIAANAVTVGKLAAGSVDATAIAADAITGKTITGGTITGAVIQTAASGQRIALNESGANKILVYNSADTAVGELSALGMGLVGSSGARMIMDPNALYPTLRMTNAAGTNEAFINVVEGTAGAADVGVNSGPFTASGLSWRWRTFIGNDFAVIERVRVGAGSTNVGGRLAMFPGSATIGYNDTTDATTDTNLVFTSGNAQLTGGRFEVAPAASANSAVYVNAATGHTGQLLRLLLNAVDKFRVDTNGNVVAAGDITSTPVTTTTGLTAATGFSTLNFYGYKIGKLVVVDLYMNRTGATITATSGNITPDVAIATLPSGWRPTHTTINGTWDDGTATGGWVVGTDGICTLRTATSDIANNRNLRLHIVFIQD
ncbi:hypothetical protein ACIQUW_33305 [Streptomyces sp. NPDC101117]|uniref:hypothetical protein n=1 Tax=Streptomyces sp. NPDC101117 TaxID=3366108 RepID=UPI003809E831